MSQSSRPNILFVVTDQQRHDTIAALGNSRIYTPNLDRLVRRGVIFTNAYSTCPVCMPARYIIRTGCEPPSIRMFSNRVLPPSENHKGTIRERCGPYLAETMRNLGYRTFGIGKFHSKPWDEDLGYDVHLHSEEMYYTPDRRKVDAYSRWISEQHPEYDFVEMLMGERSEMYYMPQMSPLPANLGVEAWASDRAIEQINSEDERPYFGFISYIGPHPPLAPPLPFNRMYDPDRMPLPCRGDIALDHMDEQIPWMNHAVFAEDVSDIHNQILYARYYGEISYIDQCLGRVLDAVEARPDADNTLICFVSDHGDHMGDHHAWQKESFFESSCRIPFLLSWPNRIEAETTNDQLVCLTDLFALATTASGSSELREGIDILGMLDGKKSGRKLLLGYHGIPGTPEFKAMARKDDWKYIFMSNGAREQLFNLKENPEETNNQADLSPEVTSTMRNYLIEAIRLQGPPEALEGNELRTFPFQERARKRLYQFDCSRGINGFPDAPEQILTTLK